MQFAAEVIAHTPPFVWLVLALILYRMWRGMRKRWVALTGLLIQAGAFIALGLAGLYSRSLLDAGGWLATAVLLFPAGFLTAPHPLSVDRGAGRLLLPGSILMPIRLLVIFVMRYGLAVVTALHPDRRASLDLATSLFSGAIAGYYIGWSAFLLQTYWRAPRPAASSA